MASGTAMAGMTPLSKNTQAALIQYCRRTSEYSFQSWDFRSALANIDLEYYRENLMSRDDNNKALMAQRAGDKRRIADLVVPIIEPQIETSLAFLVSIFLTGNPLFPVVSDPDNMQQAKAFSSLIDQQAKYGAWIRQFMMFFRKGLKYNFGAIETAWCKETTYNPFTQVSAKGANTEIKQTVWQGNKVKDLDPYNTLFDMRVDPAEMHIKGEFAGYVELYGRVALKQFIANLPYKINVTEAFESGVGSPTGLFYVPVINWDSLIKKNITQGREIDWMSWALNTVDKQGISYKNCYQVTTRYCRILPIDFEMNVPDARTPQIWKFITVNDQVLIFAEKQTNVHNFLPILFCQPIEDGLGYQTKSMGSRLLPLQDAASAFWNYRLAAKRRSVSDRAIYDPLYIRAADINSENPSAKIPMRSTAIKKPISEIFHAIPFEDRESQSFVSDAREMMNFANFISGQNPTQQGQFVKGNKTVAEYEDTMGKSSGRQMMMAWALEDQVMTPFKTILKSNILQYQGTAKVYNDRDQTVYNVDPIKLREMILEFKIADGLVPVDKLLDNETLITALQTIQAIPQLQMQFDMPKMFAQLIQTRGVDLTPFILKTPQQLPAPQVPPNPAESPTGAAATTGAPPVPV